MGFSRQEYWSRLSCPPPGDLPHPGIEPRSPTLQADSLPLSHQGSPRGHRQVSKGQDQSVTQVVASHPNSATQRQRQPEKCVTLPPRGQKEVERDRLLLDIGLGHTNPLSPFSQEPQSSHPPSLPKGHGFCTSWKKKKLRKEVALFPNLCRCHFSTGVSTPGGFPPGES